jgi:hypothetical protein
VLALGCGSAKVNAQVGTSEPSASAEPEPAPPPKKKKCESFADGCQGEAGTRVKIANSDQTIEPVTGWTYAALPEATISQLGDSGPAFAATGYDTGDAKQDIPNREAAVATLAEKVGVTVPKRKIKWNKPLESHEVGPLKVSMWQGEGAARSDKKGPMLVFSAPLRDGKAVVGIAFVPDDDTTSADAAILQSIDTIARAEGSGS